MIAHDARRGEPMGSGLELDAAWNAWPGMHGGYVMAASARMAADAVRCDLPLRAASARFLRPLESGSVVAQVVLEHASRAAATVSVRLVQNGRTAAISTFTFASASGDLSYGSAPAPLVPAPEKRDVFREAELLFPFARKLEIRPADETLPLAGADVAELTAWLRLRRPDHGLETMLILADAMPPAIYATLEAPVPVPSMEITVHVTEPLLSEEPFDGWLLARQRNVRTDQGLSIDECDLWDQDGRLMAQTRQLRRVVESAELTSGGGT